MKYNWNINYIKCLEFWLNLSQWAVMDLLTHLSTWAEWKEIDWEIYYYLSTAKMIEELPIISEKKNTFRVLLKKIKEKELIKSQFLLNKSRYRLTKKWKSFVSKIFDEKYTNQSDEKNQVRVWKKSLLGCEKNHGRVWKKSLLGCEKNHANNTTSNNNTKYNIKINKNNINILKKFSEENHKSNQTAFLLKAFFSLWYIPSKTETLESFRMWFKEKIIDTYNFENSKQIKSIINNFECYWGEQEKKPINFKTTFMNNPLLKNYK